MAIDERAQEVNPKESRRRHKDVEGGMEREKEAERAARLPVGCKRRPTMHWTAAAERRVTEITRTREAGRQ